MSRWGLARRQDFPSVWQTLHLIVLMISSLTLKQLEPETLHVFFLDFPWPVYFYQVHPKLILDSLIIVSLLWSACSWGNLPGYHLHHGKTFISRLLHLYFPVWIQISSFLLNTVTEWESSYILASSLLLSTFPNHREKSDGVCLSGLLVAQGGRNCDCHRALQEPS